MAEVKEQSTKSNTSTFDVERIRKDFPMLQQKLNGKPYIYLDSAASCQKPQTMIDRLVKFYTKEYGKPQEEHTTSKIATEAVEEARQKMADMLNAKDKKEIIFVRGATEAINIVALAFERAFLSDGDEILITMLEHHANIVPWQLACQKTGAVLKVAPITKTGELDLEEFESMISDRTKIISFSHSSHVLGTILPAKEICKIAHKRNIPVFVDGAQAAPHMPIDLQDIDCDFYGFSVHKMGGPTGIGVLYGKTDWLDKMPPHHGGSEMADTVTFKKTTYAELPQKFEAGTTAFADIIATGALIDYLNSIGREAIEAYEQELLSYALEKLRSIEGLHIIGSAKEKEPLTTFTIDGVDVKDLEKYLNNEHNIAVRAGKLSAQPLMKFLNIEKAIRASYAWFNTKEEIDALVTAIQAYMKK